MKKIILSRKGLDGGFEGAKPSPILPCGRLLSLPIPVTKKQKRETDEQGIPYDDLKFDGRSIREIIDPLHNYRFDYDEAHLDPDLDRDRFEPREQGWKRTFGQQGRAQAALKDVDKGDLFLFFGWFRRTRYENNQLRYLQPRKCGKDLHVIFGWLQVGEILKVQRDQNQDTIPKWLHYNPHIVNRGLREYSNNTIYIASDHLTLDGHNLSKQGAGTFPCFKPSLQLTAPDEKARAHWCLPKWLQNNLPGFTLPSRKNKKWQCNNEYVPFDSDGRGQEFVFDVPEPDDPDVMKWLKGLFEG